MHCKCCIAVYSLNCKPTDSTNMLLLLLQLAFTKWKLNILKLTLFWMDFKSWHVQWYNMADMQPFTKENTKILWIQGFPLFRGGWIQNLKHFNNFIIASLQSLLCQSFFCLLQTESLWFHWWSITLRICSLSSSRNGNICLNICYLKIGYLYSGLWS